MPGMLTGIFADQGQAGSSHEVSSQQVDGDLGLNLDPTIAIHSEMGGTYTNLDGSETTWSRTDDVALSVDVDATIHAVASVTQLDVDQG